MNTDSLDELMDILAFHNMEGRYIFTPCGQIVLLVDGRLYSHTDTLIDKETGEETRYWSVSRVTYQSLRDREYGKYRLNFVSKTPKISLCSPTLDKKVV